MTQFSSQHSQEDNVFFHTFLCFLRTSFDMPACLSSSVNTDTQTHTPFIQQYPKFYLSSSIMQTTSASYSCYTNLASLQFVDIKYPSKCRCYLSSKLSECLSFSHKRQRVQDVMKGFTFTFKNHMSRLKYCSNTTTVHNRFLINCNIKKVCVSCFAKDNGSFMSQFQLMPASTTVSQAVQAKQNSSPQLRVCFNKKLSFS